MPLSSIDIGCNIPRVSAAWERKFDFESWHLKEIFISRLRDDFQYQMADLDHLMILIVLKCGENSYRKEEQTSFDGVRSVRGYYEFAGFDYPGFREASDTERPLLIINLLENSLSQLAGQIGADLTAIHAAGEFTRQCGTSTRLQVPMLWPWIDHRPEATTATGQLQGRLVRYIGKGVCLWNVEVLDASGTVMKIISIPEEVYRFCSAESLFRHAVCVGDEFQLLDHENKVSFAVNLAKAVK